MTVGLFGGSFDPPHRGHVELARRAKEELGLDRLVVLVSADPGHKHVETPADVRLQLARAAFPDDEVVLDEHARTVDTLRAHPEWSDPVFLIGADEFSDFLSWREPEEVLRRTRLAVATRPGFPRERLDTVLAQLEHPERVRFFELEPTPIASRDLRRRLAAGEDVADEVPAAVAEILAREGLYPRIAGYTGTA
jgi:nicotinate-nucleotide adenylyltransferase